MRYEKLHKLIVTRGGIIIRLRNYPDRIEIPTSGFAIMFGDPAIVVSDPDFESTLDELMDNEVPYAILRAKPMDENAPKPIVIQGAEVFKRRDFAMGFATGIGANTVLDIATGREIILR